MTAIMRREFLDAPRKAITLAGMSGVGKTYLSGLLSRWGWDHYSCDYEIGSRILKEHLDGIVTKEDMRPLSRFVGRIGAADQGGLSLDDFRQRQKLYYDAECQSLREFSSKAVVTEAHSVNDSTGSLCEIYDADLIETICSSSLLVYIKASHAEQEAVLKRAQDYPKPLFFPAALFDEKLADFMSETGVSETEQINPDDFSRYVFPFLFRARLPKYQALADRYGVTVPSEELQNVESEEAFLSIVTRACEAANV